MNTTSKLAVIAAIAAASFAVPAFSQSYSFPNISLEGFGRSGLQPFSDEASPLKSDKLRVHNRSLYDTVVVPNTPPVVESGNVLSNYPISGTGMGSRGR